MKEAVMRTNVEAAGGRVTASAKTRWAGRIVSGWIVLFLVFDAAVKLLRLPAAVEATARLGYPAELVFAIGVIELLCVALYVTPRTAVVGALLLTAYLGGATATQVRVEDPWFLFPVVIGALAWAGLLLRDSTRYVGVLSPAQA
jgi:hypothetical protein